ncbi:MAG: hypothetical protein U1E65_21245 [Myxococcota bacterium]
MRRWGVVIAALWAAGCAARTDVPVSISDVEFVIIGGTRKDTGAVVLSGIYPSQLALPVNTEPLRDLFVLGWKTLPSDLVLPLDRPAHVAVGCEEILPQPDRANYLDGRPLSSWVEVAGPWLVPGQRCATVSATIAVDDDCAISSCSIVDVHASGCTFSGRLERQSCSLGAEVTGRIRRDGSRCYELMTEACKTATAGPTRFDCTVNERTCHLQMFGALSTIQATRAPLVNNGPISQPDIVDPQITRENRMAESLDRAAHLGHASDLAVVGQRIVALEHPQPRGLTCTSSDALQYYDLQLSPAFGVRLGPCALHLASSSTSGFYVLYDSPTPRVERWTAEGELLAAKDIARSGSDPCFEAVPVAAQTYQGNLWILLNGEGADGPALYLAQVRSDLGGRLNCRQIIGDPSRPPRVATDFLILGNGRFVAADGRAGGLQVIDPDTMRAQFLVILTGFPDGASLGGVIELAPAGLVAGAIPVRQPSVQFWDLRQQTFPEQIPPAHRPIPGAQPMLLGPLAPDRLLVSFWRSGPGGQISAALGVLDARTHRFEEREVELGPGLVGRIVAHPEGGALVLMPWSGDVWRVQP